MLRLVSLFTEKFPYFNYKGTFSEKKKQAPTLVGPPQLYQGSGPPSCTSPRNPTIYVHIQYANWNGRRVKTILSTLDNTMD